MKFTMKVTLALVVALSLSLLCAAAPADKEKGKEIYTKSCQSCHGANGEANAAIQKMLGTIHPLESKEVQSKTDAELAKNITQPTGKMKPFKFSSTEMADLIAFLRTFGAPKK